MFKYNSTQEEWVQLGQFIGGEAPEDRFGRSVGLSAGGYILLVGGYYNDILGDGSGQARAFRYNVAMNKWVQIGPAMNGNRGHNIFGRQVSISRDGMTVAAGGPFRDNACCNETGFVKVYSLF